MPPLVPGIAPGISPDLSQGHKPGEIGLPLCKIRRKPRVCPRFSPDLSQGQTRWNPRDKPGVVPRPTGQKGLCSYLAGVVAGPFWRQDRKILPPHGSRPNSKDKRQRVKDRIAESYLSPISSGLRGPFQTMIVCTEIKQKHPQDRKTIFETLSLPVAKIHPVLPFLAFLEKGKENHQKTKDFLSLPNP